MPTTNADDLPIALSRDSATPLSVQLATALRTAASNGHLHSGDRLPSSRALAQRLGVSRTVTSAAYDQLHAEGWTDGRRGSGTYVSAAPDPVPTPAAPAEHAVAAELLDLAPGAPCTAVIDPPAWRRAWRGAGLIEPMTRPQRAGLPEYRAIVADHLLRHRGLSGSTPDSSVIATAGTSSATAELAMAALPTGAVVAMEDPGYGRSVGALRAAGADVVGVPVDEHGVRVDLIPAGVDAVYCTPAHQYPLGARMPASRRVQLVDRARREGWLVIEDDYDGELRYDTAPLPLLASMAPDIVVHLGTTSKFLSPTLGTGWLVAAPTVTEKVLAYRELTGTSPSSTGQRVLTEFVRNGDLGRHLRRLRRELSARRAIVVDHLRGEGITIVGDEAGAHVVVPMPTAAAERKALQDGASRGIRLDGLGRHYLGAPTVFGIALGYTACSRDELVEALPTVTEIVRDAQDRRARGPRTTSEPHASAHVPRGAPDDGRR